MPRNLRQVGDVGSAKVIAGTVSTSPLTKGGNKGVELSKKDTGTEFLLAKGKSSEGNQSTPSAGSSFSLSEDPKLAVQMAIKEPPPPEVWGTVVEYIYGLDYIDEHVGYYDYETASRALIRTDVSHNVVAIVDATYGDGLWFQMRYEPYGHFQRTYNPATDEYKLMVGYDSGATSNETDLTIYPSGTTNKPYYMLRGGGQTHTRTGVPKTAFSTRIRFLGGAGIMHGGRSIVPSAKFGCGHTFP